MNFEIILNNLPQHSFLVGVHICAFIYTIDKSPYTYRKFQKAKLQHKTDQPLQTDFGRSVEVRTAIQYIDVFKPVYGIPTFYRGRLLLWTPGPVPIGTCICSNVETILS